VKEEEGETSVNEVRANSSGVVGSGLYEYESQYPAQLCWWVEGKELLGEQSIAKFS